MTDANKKQVGGEHYKKFAIEVWDFIVANNIPYLEGNAIKYIARWRGKGGIADIDKAIHYLEKLREVELARLHDETKRWEGFADFLKQDTIFNLGDAMACGTLRDQDEDAHVLNPNVRD